MQEIRETEGVKQERELRGEDLLELKPIIWSDNQQKNTEAERELISNFFDNLVNKIKKVAGRPEAAIHFYLWSKQEMTRLIEACGRCGCDLLSSLKELMGCRPRLDQQIYTFLDTEVQRCFAVGWTGRNLSVVTSLDWFGQKYHWCREIRGETVFLDSTEAFWRGIFDFADSGWQLTDDLSWQKNWDAKDDNQYRLETRLRYYNSTTAAYWYGFWGTLPDVNQPNLSEEAKLAIHDFQNANKPDYLQEYLRANVHALRWIEEKFPDSLLNDEIEKPELNLEQLKVYHLGINTITQAAKEFVRLDHFVELSDWISGSLLPPLYRIQKGLTIPIKNIVSEIVPQPGSYYPDIFLIAEINLDGYEISLDTLEEICTIEKGSFVRVAKCSQDPHIGQTYSQLTSNQGVNCFIDEIDWLTRKVKLSVHGYNHPLYMLPCLRIKDNSQIFEYATIDENPSDFVAAKVDPQLENSKDHFINSWFNSIKPEIPELEAIRPGQRKSVLQHLQKLRVRGRVLHEQQIRSITEGLDTKVQLLQGPPGTGKTLTTAIAIIARIASRCSCGDIVYVSAYTHAAINELISTIDAYWQLIIEKRPQLKEKIIISRVDATNTDAYEFSSNVNFLDSYQYPRQIKQLTAKGVLIIAGTVSAILKTASKLTQKNLDPTASMLIIDEASMMPFAYFLALTSLLHKKGTVMLAGDHRQLSPIVAHEWEKEERPPIVKYQPYISAYQAIEHFKRTFNLADAAITYSQLNYTYRLPEEIRHLIAPLYRHKDNIELEGDNSKKPKTVRVNKPNPWETIWRYPCGLILVVHSESSSQKYNPTEIAIVKQILAHSSNLPEQSVAVITPHRAQRAQLKIDLEDYQNCIRVIDTVEKMQGGECKYIIVSGTASNPLSISKNIDFILDLNRSNVAFSRAKKKLIVICSESLINFISRNLENYENTMLWKNLRHICQKKIGSSVVDNHQVDIFSL